MSAQVILKFDTTDELSRMLQLLKEFGFENAIQIKPKLGKTSKQAPKPRQAGWGKGLFAYVAPDFDNTPEGFEDYMLPAKS